MSTWSLHTMKQLKKSQGDDSNEMNENAILLAQPDQPRRCPAASFKLYKTKLTSLPDLFQQPNPYYKRPNDFWYKAQPVSEGTIVLYSWTWS